MQINPTNSASLVKRSLVIDDCPQIKCPFNMFGNPCSGVPHMSATLFGRNAPPASNSGPGLMIKFECENGHRWQLHLIDHSGGTWLEIV
jgi:hypothetical protein